MKLYLADEEKLNTYKLPDKIEESFLFSYNTKNSNLVHLNIYSEEERWHIKKTDDVTVADEAYDIKLKEFNQYNIRIKGENFPYVLYTYPNNNTNYKDYVIEGIQNITIGNSVNDNIVYDNPHMEEQLISITCTEGQYFIKIKDDTQNKIYINKNLITHETKLNIGDTIFINCLKIIWMKSFIRLYQTSYNIATNLQEIVSNQINNNDYINYDMPDNNKSLYSESDYFYNKPRIKFSFDEEDFIIDAPPAKIEKEELPALLSLGAGATSLIYSIINLYRSITGYIRGKTPKEELILSLITSISMIIFTFFIPKISQSYNKKIAAKKEQKRQKKYTEYLNKRREELNKILNTQSQSLYDNNLSTEQCYGIALTNKNKIWERQIKDNDFLTIRLGIGNVPSAIKLNAPIKRFTVDEDELLENVYKISEEAKILKNVPVKYSLSENFITSIICNTNGDNTFQDGLMLQLLTQHSPSNLKIIILTDEKNEHKWKYMKYFPHILSNNKETRYFASNDDECKKIIAEIETIYNDRKSKIKDHKDDINDKADKENMYKDYSPYYLILTDNYIKYKNNSFINQLINFKENLGFSFLIFDTLLKNVPVECDKYMYIVNGESCIFEKDYKKSNQTNFISEFYPNIDMFHVAKELANIPVQTEEEMYNLPTSISFLEMYGVGNIEQLNILNKWSTNNPITTLSCPIGVQQSGDLFKLDLHEKAHGPHGLIAGSTGSGKSEFIITYILSMAINYHPDEVKFVLIDYKGGGLAGAFENKETGVKIPHLAGTITNLDVSEMNRTLVSINSELKRRQRKFNEVRDKLGESTIDIYKYQKYYREEAITEPIPHLFIISDEFAELKSQQPEFMDELISTARIGRSLGVHLVLATQKPSGVVNDQIWSNSKFKICLKVQTTSDSQELLKKPDAAYIKETGRFYLQVGYDEIYELGQSAWAGATYIPSENVVKKIDDSVYFINNIGEITKSINNLNTTKEKNDKNGDQLTNIVKYLYNISIKNNISFDQLWLEKIPDEIYLNNLMKKYSIKPKAYEIKPIIGEYDDPKNQKQGVAEINITGNGNTLIYGMPGSGKENLLTTLVTSICTTHTTDEINIYILDFDAETLKKFNNFPQVGDIAFITETEKIVNLYEILTKELNDRKTLFADYMGNYENYIQNSGKKLPQILCIIHGYENFIETYYQLSEKYATLFKDGPKFGINFVITTSVTNAVRSRIEQLFNNKLTLRLNDEGDYRYLLDAPKELIPHNSQGRGIIKINDEAYEFQTAYISKVNDITTSIKNIAELLNNSIKNKAPQIPVMPKFFTVDKLINTNFTLKNIPVGITNKTLKIQTMDLLKNNFNLFITNNVNKNIHFVYGMIELLKQIENSRIIIIDVLKIYKNSQGINVYNDDLDTRIKQIKIEAINDKNRKKRNLFVIIGLGAFKNNVTEKTRKIFTDVFENIKNYQNNTFIIYDDYTSFKSIEMENWYINNVDVTNGMWLGQGISSQYIFKCDDISIDERKNNFPQIGYTIKNGNCSIIKYIVDKEYDSNEE